LLLLDLLHCSLVLLGHPPDVRLNRLYDLKCLSIPVKRRAPLSQTSSCPITLHNHINIEGSLVSNYLFDFFDDLRVDILLVVVFDTTEEPNISHSFLGGRPIWFRVAKVGENTL
jgi:hypothetical protein